MYITVDGYDGTGKTTLAKKIAQKYDFVYLDKPFIRMIQMRYACTLDEAVQIAEREERKLYAEATKAEKVRFYCDAFLWLKQFQSRCNIVLDRGILTTYAVFGDKETEEVFDYYILNGAFFDISIYLAAKDEERVRRIYENDPNDPDLKHPVKWRENNLEEYATTRRLNFHKISTDNKTKEEVLEEAVGILKEYVQKD